MWRSRNEEGLLNLDSASLNPVSDITANTGPRTNADLSAESAQALRITRAWFKMMPICRGAVSEVAVAGLANAVVKHAQFAPSWSVFLARLANRASLSLLNLTVEVGY